MVLKRRQIGMSSSNVDELECPVLARCAARPSAAPLRGRRTTSRSSSSHACPRARLALRAAAEEPVREAVAAREARREGVALVVAREQPLQHRRLEEDALQVAEHLLERLRRAERGGSFSASCSAKKAFSKSSSSCASRARASSRSWR